MADIPIGETAAITTLDDQEIIVSRRTETMAAAFSAIRTQQGCKVRPDRSALRCPCHGPVFDAHGGAVRQGPSTEPLPPVAARVDNGDVVAG
ncbi:Rieske [2Fe-2S] domain-containing protein [Amycolatopsis arida]|uniref:Rieske [2Fe-2S] domain-containing protein n=1 Tax=Amycolatopsis arida TaxID=587909 RepID=A0A1I5Z483_9PSEU|nr:Rieske (2Fe-2S) protein [Amycolatopsis arida]TDX90126.1 Rieske-like 2Fe-2S protein [Amycolatopsis arida]SFQ51284.1 Rieske [2Fe-2S] domain-containing protein [Amycolatopsis arida]